MAKTGYLDMPWFARANDLIGGYCVMPVDEPPSWGVPEVADFTTRELAEHIASLHNAWLNGEHTDRVLGPDVTTDLREEVAGEVRAMSRPAKPVS